MKRDLGELQENKQLLIHLKTISMYGDMEYYNNIAKSIECISTSIENKYEQTHEDDDNTRSVLEDILGCLIDSLDRLGDLKFYDGDGHRIC